MKAVMNLVGWGLTLILAVSFAIHLKKDKEEKVAIMECIESSSALQNKSVSLMGDIVKELWRQDSLITKLSKTK